MGHTLTDNRHGLLVNARAAEAQVDRTRFRVGEEDRGAHALSDGARVGHSGPDVRFEHGCLQPRAHAFTGTSPPVVAEIAGKTLKTGLKPSKKKAESAF
jgi:hypothetical protein